MQAEEHGSCCCSCDLGLLILLHLQQSLDISQRMCWCILLFLDPQNFVLDIEDCPKWTMQAFLPFGRKCLLNLNVQPKDSLGTHVSQGGGLEAYVIGCFQNLVLHVSQKGSVGFCLFVC